MAPIYPTATHAFVDYKRVLEIVILCEVYMQLQSQFIHVFIQKCRVQPSRLIETIIHQSMLFYMFRVSFSSTEKVAD